MTLIKKPLISEKATAMNELSNCVSFVVDSKANKIQIKKAIEDFYNVKVLKVRTMIYAPERKVKYTFGKFHERSYDLLKKEKKVLILGDSLHLDGS